MRSGSLAIACVAVALWAGDASAQEAACHVALSDLTVDDQPPPDQYRQMLADAIRPEIDPILACYRERIAQRPGLAGEVRLRLWVSARQVIRATQESSTLGDAQLEECARQRIYQFRLPDAAPAGGARVRFALRFTTTGTVPPGAAPPPAVVPAQPPPAVVPAQPPPVPTPPPPFVAPAVPRATVRVDAVRGAMTAEALVAALPSSRFDACPPGAGELPVRVSIARDGRISARQGRGTIRDRAAIRCIVGAVRAQPMPPAAGNTRATITVTLNR